LRLAILLLLKSAAYVLPSYTLSGKTIA